jgi:hypothetical protein
MPDNAVVLINDQNHPYLSPVCARQEDKQCRIGRALEARRLRYEPDIKCRDQGGFRQDGRSYTGQLLEVVGLLEPLPSRWNADGTWNW